MGYRAWQQQDNPYNLESPRHLHKGKAEQRNSGAADSFITTTYTPDDGQLGRNM
jgi:hypothetical protein